MDKKILRELSNYIKKNPNCIIVYCDFCNFVLFRDKLHAEDNLFDWDIRDEGEDYIPNIALIFLECAKRGIDISKITLTSV